MSPLSSTAALYDWLLLVHLLAAMVWLGGGAILVAIAFVTLRSRDAQAQARFATGLRVVGPLVLAPSTLLTLVLGVWLVLEGTAWRFGQAWVITALALIVVAAAVGAGHQARVALAAERAAVRGDHAEVRRRLVQWSWGYVLVLVLLVLVSWDMVFKPGL